MKIFEIVSSKQTPSSLCPLLMERRLMIGIKDNVQSGQFLGQNENSRTWPQNSPA